MSHQQNDIWNEQQKELQEELTMSTQTKHTTLPWEVEGQGQEVVGILAIGDNKYVAKLSGWHKKSQDANAEFIVRACNAHEELLEACKATMKYFIEYDGMDVLKLATLTLKVQAAINRAEAK